MTSPSIRDPRALVMANEDLVTIAIDATAPEPFGAYLFANNEPGAEIARGLEQSVFLEAFGNTPALLFHEYHRYEGASVFICVIDHRRRRCAGMMRLILPIPNGPGLKSLVDIEPIWERTATSLFEDLGITFDASRSWDIATLAVDPEYRTAASLGLMHMGLYQAVARLGQYFNVEWLVAILDYAVYRLIRLQLHKSFNALAAERPYLGSVRSVPAYCPLPIAEAEMREKDALLHEQIYIGSALKAALRQIDLPSAIDKIESILRS